MILVDTSVWIDHLRKGDTKLVKLLQDGSVLMHPFIIGEIACGSLSQRLMILNLLRDLPPALVAQDTEAMSFIDRHALHGRGIGYIDVHLLASTALTLGARLWTRDKRLHAIAVEKGLAQT